MDTLPLKRDLTLAYRASGLIALLMVVVSAGARGTATRRDRVEPSAQRAGSAAGRTSR